MPLSGLDRFLWAAAFAAHLLLLAVLFYRRRVREFPWFTLLIAHNVVRTVVLYAVRLRGTDHDYLVAYIAGEVIDQFLQFAVLYEVATHVFRPMGRWAQDTRRGFLTLIAGSLLVAVALTWLAAPTRADWEINLFGKAGFLTSCLMSELFLGMVLLSVTAGLPWKTHVARIAHGLGAYSLLDILIEAGLALFSLNNREQVGILLSHTRMLVYLGCCVYWIVTLWQAAPVARPLPPAVRLRLQHLQDRVAVDLFTLRSWRKP